MKFFSNINDVHNPKMYRKRILEHYKFLLEKKQKKILSWGYNQYRGDGWVQAYPISGYIQIRAKLILFGINSANKLNNDDIKTIINQQFRPLSIRKNIIGIIDSYHGIHEIENSSFFNEDYPIAICQKNKLISINNHAQRDTLIKRCLFCEDSPPSHTKWPVGQFSGDKDYNMLAFILDGSVRIKIFVRLLKGPSYSYKIASEEELLCASVYRSMKDLLKEGIVECITSGKRRKGKE